jgi:ATP-binding cassette subfamily F protein uup
VNLVNLEAAAKAYGDRALLDGVSLGVAAGDRIGVVGRNGAGKTTLLAALAGTADLDSGRATRARGTRIGYLPQHEDLTGRVRDIVFAALPEHVWAAEARSRAVVTALLSGIDLTADTKRLSGGERRRTALAALLRRTHDLLLLDEPTNHLDIEAIRWLAGYLLEYGSSYVVVTHDRWFLDQVSQRTWELADGQVHSYEGGYSAYVLARAERARIAEAEDQRRRGLLRKELAWLRRGPPARTSKPKFRLEAASALIADEPAPRDGVELARMATARLGKTVVELADVTVTAGQRTLLDAVTWPLGPGERAGVVGVNGSGKTTLLRLLAGLLPVSPRVGELLGRDEPSPGRLSAGGLSPGTSSPGRMSAGGASTGGVSTGWPSAGGVPAGGVPAGGVSAGGLTASGAVVRGKTVRIGYLTQEPAPIDPGLRALEAAEQVRGSVRIGTRETSASALLDRLGLRGDRQWTLVGELSGGERRRLQLLMLLMAEPNVLLLDEPTNDLDIETLNELEDMLDGWPGSVVVVSHDRYFLERVTDHVLALVGGRLAFLPGGVDEYLELRDRARETRQAGGRPGAGGTSGQVRGRPGGGGPSAATDATVSPGGPGSAARQRTGQKELSRLERQLGKVSDQEAELNAALAANVTDYTALIELGGRLRELHDEKASLEERWLALAEELAD